MIRILELLICLILKILDLLSGRPPNREREEEEGEEKEQDEVSRIVNRTRSQERYEKPEKNNKNLVVLNEEVSSLISNIMQANKETQELDMKEISRLRSEVAKLQQELILAKADNVNLRNKTKYRSDDADNNKNGV